MLKYRWLDKFYVKSKYFSQKEKFKSQIKRLINIVDEIEFQFQIYKYKGCLCSIYFNFKVGLYMLLRYMEYLCSLRKIKWWLDSRVFYLLTTPIEELT